jgi:hypothetical protein
VKTHGEGAGGGQMSGGQDLQLRTGGWHWWPGVWGRLLWVPRP